MSEERPRTDGAQCPHSDLHFHLNTASYGDTPMRTLEVTGYCKICSAPMRFRGQVGSSPAVPMVSAFGEELRAPFLFGNEQPTGREAGFTVSFRGVPGDDPNQEGP